MEKRWLALLATTGKKDFSKYSWRRPSSLRPAGWEGSTESPVTAGTAQEAVFRSPTMPAQNSLTWNSSSFILQEWFGRQVFAGCSLQKAYGVKEEFCETAKGAGSCLTIFPNSTADKLPLTKKRGGAIHKATKMQNGRRSC